MRDFDIELTEEEIEELLRDLPSILRQLTHEAKISFEASGNGESG